MRKLLVLSVGVVLMGMSVAGYAELQNVTVGGQLEMRGRYHHSTFTTGLAPEVRVPAGWLRGRSTGGNVVSIVDWDDRGTEWTFAESAISLNVGADFSDNVSSFIEFYSYDIWGEDFRSNYVTGADGRGNTADDIEVLQAYIQADEVFGYPLRVRIGRQTMKFGKGWLVDDKTSPTQRQGFDAIRLTYNPTDDIEIDAWWAKLADTSPAEKDGDVDFYGIHGTYSGIEAVKLSAYWMFVRDARGIAPETNRGFIGEWLEEMVGVDDYDPTQLHAIGMRAWGNYASFDYDLELTYQFGEAGRYGSMMRPVGFGYGDNDADFDNFGMDVELGYNFDVKYSPRVFIGGAWLQGEDNRDITFGEWLGSYVNPFYQGQASVNFNRMFSNINYCPAYQDNAWLSNFKQVRIGASIKPTDKTWVMLRVQKLWADEPFDWPVNFEWNGNRVAYAPFLSFWTEESDDDYGYSTCLIAKYNYSPDLTLILYWGHMFSGEGAYDGSYSFFNGTMFNGGTDDDDADYAFFWIINKF